MPVNEKFSVVSSYSLEGISPSAQLESKLKKQYGNLSIQDFSVVGYETGAIGLKIRNNEIKTKLKHNNQNLKNYSVFSEYPEYMIAELSLKNQSDVSDRSVDLKNSFALENHNKDSEILRKQLLKGVPNNNFSSKTKIIDAFKSGHSFRSSSGNIGGGSTTSTSRMFSPYNQERRVWNSGGSGRCWSGCAPVAYAILFEYWDRHGFANMVGNSRSNSFSSHTSPTVRNMIDSIRGAQNTTCGGSTLISNNPNAMQYVRSRGYSGSITNSNYGRLNRNAWNNLKNEIDNNRPVVTSINVSGNTDTADHSIVVYGYRDAPGTASDEIYYINGWGSNVHNAIGRGYHFHTANVRICKERRGWWWGGTGLTCN